MVSYSYKQAYRIILKRLLQEEAFFNVSNRFFIIEIWSDICNSSVSYSVKKSTLDLSNWRSERFDIFWV